MSTDRPPDVLGLKTRDAQAILEEAGWEVAEQQLTLAPAEAAGESEPDCWRVARVRVIGEKTVSLACVRARPLRD
jgi:hypothetical protein